MTDTEKNEELLHEAMEAIVSAERQNFYLTSSTEDIRPLIDKQLKRLIEDEINKRKG